MSQVGVQAESPAAAARVTGRFARMRDTRTYRFAAAVVGFGCLVGVWYLVRVSGIVNPSLLPSPDHVARVAVRLFAHQGFAEDLWLSVRRVFIGVSIGVVAAVPAGFLLAWYRPIRDMFDPVVNFFRALPPIALVPLVIVYFGIGEFAGTSILVYAAFFAGVVVMFEGVSQIDRIYISAARALGANEFEVFWKVIVPATIPQFFVAYRVALGVSWATLVAAELVAAQRGLGAVIKNAGNFFQIDVIYVGIIVIGIAAMVMDQVLRVIMRYFLRWQDRAVR